MTEQEQIFESSYTLESRRRVCAVVLRIFTMVLCAWAIWGYSQVIESFVTSRASVYEILSFIAFGLGWELIPLVLVFISAIGISRGSFGALSLAAAICLLMGTSQAASQIVMIYRFDFWRYSLWINSVMWFLYLFAAYLCLRLRNLELRSPPAMGDFVRAQAAFGRAKVALTIIVVAAWGFGSLLVLGGLIAMMMAGRDGPTIGFVLWLVASPFLAVGGVLFPVCRNRQGAETLSSARLVGCVCCLVVVALLAGLIAQVFSTVLSSRYGVATQVLTRAPLIFAAWAMSDLLHARRTSGFDPNQHALGFQVITGDDIPMAQRKT